MSEVDEGTPARTEEVTVQPGTEARPEGGWKALFFRRARGGRCPQCGQGGLFAGWARLEERCSECGLVYRREQGAQTGSMYLSAAVTQVFAAGVIAALYLLTDWSVGLGLAVGIPLVLGFSFWFMPFSMSLWVAVEYSTDVSNGEAWATPRRGPGGQDLRSRRA